MKKILYILIVGLLFTTTSFAQETETVEEEKKETTVKKKKDKPVRSPWNSGLIMSGKTSVVPSKGSMRFDLAHHFGSMNNGTSDLLGIYAPAANVRMGLNYVVIDNLELGIGVTKNNITTDLNAKYTVFEQTRKNTMPVSITLYGNIGIDGRNSDVYGTEYTFTDRFSYHTQLIVGRKFTKYISAQLGASFTHFNSMPEGMNHDVISAHAAAKFRVTPTLSIIANTDIPLKLRDITQHTEFETAKPNIQAGVELITTTHAFHIYVGTANEILTQNALMFNQSEFNLEGLRFGLVLTKL